MPHLIHGGFCGRTKVKNLHRDLESCKEFSDAHYSFGYNGPILTLYRYLDGAPFISLGASVHKVLYLMHTASMQLFI